MNVADHIRSARALESRGQLRAAIHAYEELAAAGLGGAEPLLLKAALHKEFDELRPALAALEQAEAAAPRSHEPKLRLAQLTTSTGRDVAAISYLRDAIANAPDLAELRVNLADISSRLGWLDTGYWAIFPLPEALPDWWARARKTGIDQFVKARSEVRDLLTKRIRSEPLDYGLAWELAQRFFALGRLRMAERLCDGMIERLPGNFPVHDLKTKVIVRRRGVEAALDYLRSLPPELQRAGDFPARMARLLNELKRFEEVLETFARRPDVATSFDARYLGAVAMLSLGEFGPLRTHCQSWIRQSPDEVLPAAVMLSTVPFDGTGRTPLAEGSLPPLVQFWDAPDVPPDVGRVLDSWVDAHPGLQRTLYDEEGARSFIVTHFGGQAVATFDLCHHAAMKADFFRIAYLYAAGGIYVDADERCLHEMGSLLCEAAGTELAAVRSGDLMGYLHNFFLGAKPRSRIMEIALEDASRVIHACHAEQRRPSIWHATGPGLITRAAARHLAQTEQDAGKLLLLPFQQFRSFVHTAGDLEYKRRGDANWQLF